MLAVLIGSYRFHRVYKKSTKKNRAITVVMGVIMVFSFPTLVGALRGRRDYCLAAGWQRQTPKQEATKIKEWRQLPRKPMAKKLIS